jgi:hypothetical protein
MQLWGKMAAQNHAHQQSQSKSNLNAPHLTGHASNLRPLFFHGQGAALSGLLSGKAGSSKDTPLGNKAINVPISSPSSPGKPMPMPTQEQAMLAAMASQTLLGRLGSAFWEAFSGSSSPSLMAHAGSAHYFHGSANGGTKTHSWDADKVRKVLEGKAVVRVVDVEPVSVKVQPPSSPKSVSTSSSPASKWTHCSRRREREEAAAADVGAKGVGEKVGSEKAAQKCEYAKCVHDILEENFRSLSLGKKA